MYGKTIESLESSPIKDISGYRYFINPLTDGVPRMDPLFLKEVVDWMLCVCDFDCDCILAPESMGIPLAVPVSLTKGVPYSVIRKRSYGLPGEIPIVQTTGYSKADMFINGVGKGDRVVIVDDVVSTGGTMCSIVEALLSEGIEIADILIPVDKNNGSMKVLERTGVPVKTMVRVTVTEDGVECYT